MGKGAISAQQKYSLKECTRTEVRYFFGAKIILENTYSRQFNTMEDHWKDFSTSFGGRISLERYKSIMNAMILTNEEILKVINLLLSKSNKLFIPSNVCCVDESMYAYQVSKEKKEKYKLE